MAQSKGQGGSLHVFAFDGEGRMVLAESEGSFTEEQWRRASSEAERMCGVSSADDFAGSNAGLSGWLREVVGQDLKQAGRWRGGS